MIKYTKYVKNKIMTNVQSITISDDEIDTLFRCINFFIVNAQLFISCLSNTTLYL